MNRPFGLDLSPGVPTSQREVLGATVGPFGTVLVAVREVVSATVGSLGAVLGVQNCRTPGTELSTLDSNFKSPVNNKKKEFQIP